MNDILQAEKKYMNETVKHRDRIKLYKIRKNLESDKARARRNIVMFLVLQAKVLTCFRKLKTKT